MPQEYMPGMGEAVAARTINRPGETWKDVAYRVALGNSLLDQNRNDFHVLYQHLVNGVTLMSGRHLQHGDESQPTRPGTVFTNCSTAMLRFLTFQLLLSGSGVGSCYDDHLMVVDWTKQPIVVTAIREDHPDVVSGLITDYHTPDEIVGAIYFKVPDSREGWSKAIEQIEKHTYLGHYDRILVLDFSDVRPFGEPIRGMQNRPASGPGPLMQAINNLNSLRFNGMQPWEAAMWADHYLAECVLVGGARRAARIAIKHWKDKSIFDFIQVKRPREFVGKSREEIIRMRQEAAAAGDPHRYQSQLWSANNSVAVDQEFYDALHGQPWIDPFTKSWAMRVWNTMMDAQYGDGTGEPGFLNVNKLDVNLEGAERYRTEPFVDTADEETVPLLLEIANRVLDHSYQMMVNPCGEVPLFIMGGFCNIGSLAPFHAKSYEELEEAARATTRALIRVNTMDSIYKKEVQRTNRIAVGLTGIFEWMWSWFGLTFRDAIADGPYDRLGVSEKALPFWRMVHKLGVAVNDEAIRYSEELGLVVPHTNKMIAPTGTISKLFGLTEGAHLPAMRKYLRYVQFRNDDPLVQQYEARGYPVRRLKKYSGTTIVGFPTAPVITTLEGLDVTTASEATPKEQFRWIQLLEHYWLGKHYAGQVSYTLKYDPAKVSFKDFEQIMRENIGTVKAVSVMPQEDTSSYEYLPETPISDEEYDELVQFIEAMEEDVDRAHVECAGGHCPVHFDKEEVAA